MLAFIGGLFLFFIAFVVIVIVASAILFAKCHDKWVQFLTGSDEPGKQVPNPYYYHPDGTPRD